MNLYYRSKLSQLRSHNLPYKTQIKKPKLKNEKVAIMHPTPVF